MSSITDPAYVQLYEYIQKQVTLLYVSLGISVLMMGWFYYLNSVATKAENASRAAYIKA